MFTIFYIYAVFQKKFTRTPPITYTPKKKLLPCFWYPEETFPSPRRTFSVLSGMTQSTKHLLPTCVLTLVYQATSFPPVSCVSSTLGHSLISSHIPVLMLLQFLLPRISFFIWLLAENATSSVRPSLISQTTQIFPSVAFTWQSAFLLSQLLAPSCMCFLDWR